jgi:hypothetical protein
VEAYEWREGVLYGPYLKACRLSPQEGTMMPIRLTLGLIQDPSMTTAWHLWTIIVPRRTITGRLVRGQVWRRHDGRRWLYKKLARNGCLASCRTCLDPITADGARHLPVSLSANKPYFLFGFCRAAAARK